MIRILLVVVVILVCLYLSNKVYISSSTINGQGLFAAQDFKKGDVILDNIFPHKDTNEVLYDSINEELFNRYISKEGIKINHCSESYNSYVHTNDNKIYQLLSKKDIPKNTEITANYDITNKKYPFIDTSKEAYKKC